MHKKKRDSDFFFPVRTFFGFIVAEAQEIIYILIGDFPEDLVLAEERTTEKDRKRIMEGMYTIDRGNGSLDMMVDT